MQKQKNLVLTGVIYAVLIGVYNMLIFIIFNNFSGVFWLSYSFSMLAFALQITSMFFAFRKADIETAFFGMPLFSFSVFYLSSQLCVGLVFMFLQRIGMTIAAVVQILMLAAFLVVAIIAIMARDTVQNISENYKQNIVRHKSANVDVDVLLDACTDAELKQKLRKLSETIKYSDPMTNEAVADVEERIQQKVSQLRDYFGNGETEQAMKACSALELLYVERNKKLLISK
ncbi:MAG: hypothetical protein FWH20_01545 [Oscillospiraceae bacterium]|nr:hypothetical protein [Oscillospiraceae bacterium]